MSIEDFRAVSRAKLSGYRRLLSSDDGLDDTREWWDAFFRDIHSIKGNAGFFELEDVRRLAHRIESVLDLLRSRRVSFHGGIENVLSRGIDLLDAAIAGTPFDPSWSAEYESDIQNLLDRLDRNEPTPAEVLESLARLLRTRAVDDVDGRGWPALEKLLRGVDAVRREIAAADQGEWAQVLSEASFRLKPEVTQALGRLQGYLSTIETRPLDENEAGQLLQALLELRSYEADNPRVQTAVIFLEPLARFAADANLAASLQYRREFRSATLDLWASVVGPIPSRVQRTGEILVEEGLIQPDDVKGAVNRQKKIGEILVEQGKVRTEDVDRSLDRQRRQIRMRELFQVETGLIGLRVELLEEMNAVLSVVRDDLERAVGRPAGEPGTGDEVIPALRDALENAERLRRIVASLRSVRFADVVETLPRHVRDVSRYLGIRIALTTAGESVEIPRETAAALSAPILHLVNNALTHGFSRGGAEDPDPQAADHGTIRISAASDDGTLTIEVADNGRGWSRDEVVEKALRDGYIQADEAEAYRSPRFVELLFRPGFSTADRVDEWSGRGVGLDAVARTAASLGGNVEAFAEPGRGSRFRINIPLKPA